MYCLQLLLATISCLLNFSLETTLLIYFWVQSSSTGWSTVEDQPVIRCPKCSSGLKLYARNFLKYLARKIIKFKNTIKLIWKWVHGTKTWSTYSLRELKKDHVEKRITGLTDCQCCELGSAGKGHRGERQWRSLRCSESTCKINAEVQTESVIPPNFHSILENQAIGVLTVTRRRQGLENTCRCCAHLLLGPRTTSRSCTT